MQRNAKKTFTFSDGIVIPPGAKIGTPVLFLHRDPTIYENPEVFDGFRFSRLREKSQGTQAVKYSMISTDPAYQLFGHGKHAWFVHRNLLTSLLYRATLEFLLTVFSQPWSLFCCQRNEDALCGNASPI